VRGARGPDHVADLARQREVAAAFLAAARGGDLSALVAVLDSDVILTADGAAIPSGRPVTLRGADTVARNAATAASRGEQSQLALIDGAVGIVFAPAGRLQVVLALTVSPARRVTAIDVIADPDRLRRLRLAVLPG
jgi:RNA polymerase sigma-70 factor (ECF subfamily)